MSISSIRDNMDRLSEAIWKRYDRGDSENNHLEALISLLEEMVREVADLEGRVTIAEMELRR